MGYVPEFPCLYEMLTVREQFEFIVRAYKLDREKTRTYAAELIDRFRLTEVVDTLCRDLSKGMQQKVSIICALLPRPKLLLLDEPMLGLDPHAIKELRQLIQELAEEGVAVLVSTHMIATVEGIWNKAYIMRKGKVISCHRKEEMIGMWAESLERIFFAETESYDSPWFAEEEIHVAEPASANSQKKAQSSGKKPNPAHAKAPVSHPKTTKKKKGKKKK